MTGFQCNDIVKGKASMPLVLENPCGDTLSYPTCSVNCLWPIRKITDALDPTANVYYSNPLNSVKGITLFILALNTL